MSYDPSNRWSASSNASVGQIGIDTGLRSYMLRVYNYMASGLALTGVVAYVFAQSGMYVAIAHTPLIWLVMLAVLFIAFGVFSEGRFLSVYLIGFGIVMFCGAGFSLYNSRRMAKLGASDKS